MEVLTWLNSNWINLVQTGGIIASIFVVRQAILADARIRQIGNSIQLTDHHRRLWERLLADPQLSRILDVSPDISKTPISAAEEMFVIFIILHLSDTFYAMQTGFYPRLEGMTKDVKQFFSRSIPFEVWDRVRKLQDREFAAFVDNCLENDESEHYLSE